MRYTRVWLVPVATVLLLTLSGQGKDQGKHFTHGPMLGRLTTEGVGVWARTERPGAFAVRYGLTPQRMDQVSPAVKTHLEHDNTAWVALTGLEANTAYYYELVFPEMTPDGHSGRTGSFTTLPAAEDFAHPEFNPDGRFNFSFEFGCGNNQKYYNSNGPSLPAFNTMFDKLKGRIHFAILNGDWLYEYQREFTPAAWAAQTGATALPQVLEVAPTLAGVWENYKYFLDHGAPLVRWHAHVPTYYNYDDHEVLNDVYGTGTAGLRDRRAVFRDIGVRGWYDYLAWSNPVGRTQATHFGRAKLESGSDVLHDADADFTRLDLEQATNLHVHWGGATAGVNDNSLDGVGGDPNAGVYDIVEILDGQRLRISPAARENGPVSYSIGRRNYFLMTVGNCDFFFVDTRGQRDMHDVSQPAKKGLSMLGVTQRDWLLEGMRASEADFFFVVSSVNFTIPHVGGGLIRDAANKDEAWTVFLDEREKLINAWDKMAQPVFVLTGDLHNSFAIQITDNVWEFASGPHNSQNHHAGDEGGHAPNGRFVSGPREVDIRWSSYFHPDIPRTELRSPMYCVVQINNVRNAPLKLGGERYFVFPRPQAIFQFFDGKTGDLLYAESILAAEKEDG